MQLGIVRPEATFLDAGSGDGRSVAVASALGLRAYGIEVDGDLVKESRIHLQQLGLAGVVVAGNFKEDAAYDQMGVTFDQIGVFYNFANGVHPLAVRMSDQSPSGTVLLLQDFSEVNSPSLPLVQRVQRNHESADRVRGSLYILQKR